MIILNFTHPLPESETASVAELTGQVVEQTIDIKTNFDPERDFAPQVRALLDNINLTAAEWQTAPILINSPAQNVIAVILLAELHGRMGYFPPVLRLKPVPEATPPRFVVAEVINLQAIRDKARGQR